MFTYVQELISLTVFASLTVYFSSQPLVLFYKCSLIPLWSIILILDFKKGYSYRLLCPNLLGTLYQIHQSVSDHRSAIDQMEFGGGVTPFSTYCHSAVTWEMLWMWTWYGCTGNSGVTRIYSYVAGFLQYSTINWSVMRNWPLMRGYQTDNRCSSTSKVDLIKRLVIVAWYSLVLMNAELFFKYRANCSL